MSSSTQRRPVSRQSAAPLRSLTLVHRRLSVVGLCPQRRRTRSPCSSSRPSSSSSPFCRQSSSTRGEAHWPTAAGVAAPGEQRSTGRCSSSLFPLARPCRRMRKSAWLIHASVTAVSASVQLHPEAQGLLPQSGHDSPSGRGRHGAQQSGVWISAVRICQGWVDSARREQPARMSALRRRRVRDGSGRHTGQCDQAVSAPGRLDVCLCLWCST